MSLTLPNIRGEKQIKISRRVVSPNTVQGDLSSEFRAGPNLHDTMVSKDTGKDQKQFGGNVCINDFLSRERQIANQVAGDISLFEKNPKNNGFLTSYDKREGMRKTA